MQDKHSASVGISTDSESCTGDLENKKLKRRFEDYPNEAAISSKKCKLDNMDEFNVKYFVAGRKENRKKKKGYPSSQFPASKLDADRYPCDFISLLGKRKEASKWPSSLMEYNKTEVAFTFHSENSISGTTKYGVHYKKARMTVTHRYVQGHSVDSMRLKRKLASVLDLHYNHNYSDSILGHSRSCVPKGKCKKSTFDSIAQCSQNPKSKGKRTLGESYGGLDSCEVSVDETPLAKRARLEVKVVREGVQSSDRGPARGILNRGTTLPNLQDEVMSISGSTTSSNSTISPESSVRRGKRPMTDEDLVAEQSESPKKAKVQFEDLWAMFTASAQQGRQSHPGIRIQDRVQVRATASQNLGPSSSASSAYTGSVVPCAEPPPTP